MLSESTEDSQKALLEGNISEHGLLYTPEVSTCTSFRSSIRHYPILSYSEDLQYKACEFERYKLMQAVCNLVPY